MSTLFEQNRCGVCKKLFCCVSCREAHEVKKHPNRDLRDLKCPLCLEQKLPLKVFESSQLLCHVVFQHLPLGCILCGQLFKDCQDLEVFDKCKWYAVRNRQQSLVPNAPKKSLPLATPSPINRGLSCPEARREEDYNGVGGFASPPELSRNTSTPMHVTFMGQRSDFHFKTPKVPNFSLKTPKTPRTAPQTPLENSEVSSYFQATGGSSSSTASGSDSQFVSFSLGSSRSLAAGGTPLRSIISKRQTDESGHSRDFSKSISREYSRSHSGRKLEVMQEQEENLSPSNTMDLTDVQGVEMAASGSELGTKENKDPNKKVRFSDLHEKTGNGDQNTSGNEEFYEAVETVSNEKKVDGEETLNGTNGRMNRDNERNSEKEKASEVLKPPSRVVMMLVVENGNNVPQDLTPLINSSIQRCQETLDSRSASLGSFYSSMSSSAQVETSASGGRRRSVTSLDSFMSASSVYSTPSPPSSLVASSPRVGGEGTSSGGILSAMAHMMRYALRGLPGAGSSSRTVSREPILPHRDPGSRTSSIGSSHSLSSPASSLLQNPGKRPRDSHESPLPRRSDEGSSPRRSDEGSSPRNDEATSPRREVTSPAPKRPRSLHKIKARDPLPRMKKNPTPPTRGVPSGTQCPQQGSSPAGDTDLSIPSRAHRSTQTE